MNKFLKTEHEIKKWLDKYKINAYTLIPDIYYGFIIDIKGYVNLSSEELEFIPVKFNTVSRDFSCSHNNLTSLEFSPFGVGGNFHCSYNKITSLEGCPRVVKQNFDCFSNNIFSLEFCPQMVQGEFLCGKNTHLGKFQNIKNNSNLLSLSLCANYIKKEDLLYMMDDYELKSMIRKHDLENNLEDKKSISQKIKKI